MWIFSANTTDFFEKFTQFSRHSKNGHFGEKKIASKKRLLKKGGSLPLFLYVLSYDLGRRSDIKKERVLLFVKHTLIVKIGTKSTH